MSRILVIDDNIAVRMTLRMLLETNNFHVQEACNGGEGLEQARRAPPDLIMCDLKMPVMDGLETLRQLRADPRLRQVPFVMISGSALGDVEDRAMQSGASAVLYKPFKLLDLLGVVRTQLAVSASAAVSAPPTPA